MKLVAGSYEKFLWGWQIGVKKPSLDAVFSYEAHRAPMKCLDSLGSIVASGGADEIIKVFDVNAKKELGLLQAQTGTITSLQFWKARESSLNRPTTLFSGSEDGTIGVWDCDSWAELKRLTSHKSAINSLTVHPSGRIALSVDKGGHLKMWNLMNGRCTYTKKLLSEASLIKLSPDLGEAYAIVKGRIIEVRDVYTGKVLHTYKHNKQILCLAQNQDRLIVSGGEDCAIRVWDNRCGKSAMQFQKAHTSRVKGVCCLNAPEALSLPHFFASASSDGSVKIWDTRIHQELEDGASSVAAIETATKARLTCLVSCGAATKLESIPVICLGGVDKHKKSHTDVNEPGDAVPEDGVKAGKEDPKINKPKKKKIAVKVQTSPTQPLKKRKRHLKSGASRDSGGFGKAERKLCQRSTQKKMKIGSELPGSPTQTSKIAKRHKISRTAEGACPETYGFSLQ